MLAISPHNGSVCTRCALRFRLLAFQQQRRPHTTHVRLQDGNNGSPSRYQKSRAGSRDNVPAGKSNKATKHLDMNKATKYIKFERKRNVTIRTRPSFREILMQRIGEIKEQVKNAPVLEQLAKDRNEMDGKREQSFETLWKDFTQNIIRGDGNWRPSFMGGSDLNGSGGAELREDLHSSWRERGLGGLDDRIKYTFYGHVTNMRFTPSEVKNQITLADLRYPSEWFPATRQMQRTIHLHVGPTNSGKTYRALQRLEQAERGVYAGPLRLLAHEVFSRMNAKGKRCALVTGEERRRPEGDHISEDGRYELVACTVEMVPLNNPVDVAVIDEIQMIGNAERGWAWTQAVLGVQAREVHLCGEARTVPLIKELCASVGEKLEIHEYTRLSPLEVAPSSLDGDLRKLKKGDCIVSFSVMGIHALRRTIEKSTGKKVAIVYGSLPPETRAQQARLFNEPDNDYDYLVASDAVGMGLNLAIKRIIFETSSKYDGTARRTLSIADIKQIGGRAGRFRTAAQATDAHVSEEALAAAKGELIPEAERDEGDTPENVGLVTTLERFDFPIVAAAMDADPEPIQSAGLFPPAPVLERFASYFPPGTPFSYILTRLHELSQMHRRFHLCGLKDQIWVADIIEPVEGLTVTDRNNICSAPASKTDAELWNKLLPAYARIIAQQSGGSIVDIQELPLETLEAEEADTTNGKEYLRELERLHKGVVTYLWLSYRFPGVFSTRALAFHVKSLVEEKIENVLGQISFSDDQRRKLAKAREKQLLQELMLQQQQEQMYDNARESQAGAAPVGPMSNLSDDVGDGSEDPDAEEAKVDYAMARFADEESSVDSDSEEPEIGEELAGIARQPEASDTADQFRHSTAGHRHQVPTIATRSTGGDSFSGEQYLGLEEEADVEEEREFQVDGAGESRDQPAQETVDAETIIEELTRHECDIPRKPNEVTQTKV